MEHGTAKRFHSLLVIFEPITTKKVLSTVLTFYVPNLWTCDFIRVKLFRFEKLYAQIFIKIIS